MGILAYIEKLPELARRLEMLDFGLKEKKELCYVM